MICSGGCGECREDAQSSLHGYGKRRNEGTERRGNDLKFKNGNRHSFHYRGDVVQDKCCDIYLSNYFPVVLILLLQAESKNEKGNGQALRSLSIPTLDICNVIW